MEDETLCDASELGERDILTKEKVELKHRKGTELVSDALTKTLDRVKLGEARDRLGLIAC